MDWQEIKLQETDSDDVEAGRVPRTLKVELTNQLVDRCIPGDVVEICGLVKVLLYYIIIIVYIYCSVKRLIIIIRKWIAVFMYYI